MQLFYGCSGHYVSPERLKLIGESIEKVAIITGDQDLLVNPERSEDLRDGIPKSEYLMYEGGGQ